VGILHGSSVDADLTTDVGMLIGPSKSSGGYPVSRGSGSFWFIDPIPARRCFVSSALRGAIPARVVAAACEALPGSDG